jgi:hypothetical protein
MKTIEKYQIINHGVQNEQYFQGCGVSHTEFTDVSTGIGNNAHDALEDALHSLADDWDTEPIKNDLSGEQTVFEKDGCDCYHYVSVRVK